MQYNNNHNNNNNNNNNNWYRNEDSGIAEKCYLVFCKDPQESSRDLRRLVVTEPQEKDLY